MQSLFPLFWKSNSRMGMRWRGSAIFVFNGLEEGIEKKLFFKEGNHFVCFCYEKRHMECIDKRANSQEIWPL